MTFDHESWLRKQGVKITGRHTLRRALMPGYMHWDKEGSNEVDDWSGHLKTTTEQVYQVELDEKTIERIQHFESTVAHALDYVNRSSKASSYRGLSPGDLADYFVENKERHLELLKENSMYRDAWKEFQSIRVLLGETPHWP